MATAVVSLFCGSAVWAQQISAGSGFVVSSPGWVVTCYHVVRDAVENKGDITVVFSGQELKAEFVGSDPRRDLALLEVRGANLRPLPLARSSDIVPGEDVSAYGFPMPSATESRFMSARGSIQSIGTRQAEGLGRINTIMTDARISPGNSGGPLLNRYGEVVGVVNAKLIGERIVEGGEDIGLAVHVDYVRTLMQDEPNVVPMEPNDPRTELTWPQVRTLAEQSVCQVLATARPDTGWGTDTYWSYVGEESITQLIEILSRSDPRMTATPGSGKAVRVRVTIGGAEVAVVVEPKSQDDGSFSWLCVYTWFTAKDEYRGNRSGREFNERLAWANEMNRESASVLFYWDKDGDLAAQSQITFVDRVSSREICGGILHLVRSAVAKVTAYPEKAERYLR